MAVLRAIFQNIPACKAGIGDFSRFITKIVENDFFFHRICDDKEITGTAVSFSINRINTFQGSYAVLEKNRFLLFYIAVKNTVPTLCRICMIFRVGTDDQICGEKAAHVAERHKWYDIFAVR